jgi:hypothetical protein
VDELTGKSPYDIPPSAEAVPAPVPKSDLKEPADNTTKTGKEAFEHNIWNLLAVYNYDIKTACYAPGSIKIDPAARKKYFTDRGWAEYQKYAEEMKSYLRKDPPRYAVNGIFDKQSKKYSYWFGKFSGLSSAGEFEEFLGCDTVTPGGPKFRISVKFSPTTSIDPKNTLIDTWDVEVDFPPPRKVSPYIYKSKNPFWIFTCRSFGLGCG